MAVSTPSNSDYFTSRPALRSRPPPSTISNAAVLGSPNSPRTPLLGRSISGQYGSPGSFRVEQEDYVVYELGARHFSAGFAGESRPRCVLSFSPENGRRVGDWRAYEPEYWRQSRKEHGRDEQDWGGEYELYKIDLRAVDLGLVEDKLERALRTAHTDFLQLDQRPKKAILVVPSLLPTPLMDVALKVLFNHHTQPPSVMLMTVPIMACVGAGLRNALVVDIGWKETVVTAVGEYKQICQRRSARAGKAITREMARVLGEEVKVDGAPSDGYDSKVSFEYAEKATQRLAWCRQKNQDLAVEQRPSTITLPSIQQDSQHILEVPFARLSEPAETSLFNSSEKDDDDYLPTHILAYRVLLSLHSDMRALCISRIILTGGVSQLLGLKTRLLQELSHLVETRGWDPVHSYGTADLYHQHVLHERSVNVAGPRGRQERTDGNVTLSPAKKPIQESIPHRDRIHDDKFDSITQKAERGALRGRVEPVKGVVRGVETLSAWAGASLLASLRVKGVHEVEREDFLKHGYKDDVAAII